MSRDERNGLERLSLVSVFCPHVTFPFLFLNQSTADSSGTSNAPTVTLNYRAAARWNSFEQTAYCVQTGNSELPQKNISLRHRKQQSYVTCVDISDFDPNLVGRLFFVSSSLVFHRKHVGPEDECLGILFLGSRNPPWFKVFPNDFSLDRR